MSEGKRTKCDVHMTHSILSCSSGTATLLCRQEGNE
jgi:hypothetical protein